MALGLSWPTAHGIFWDWEENPCPLCWQADSNHGATRDVPSSRLNFTSGLILPHVTIRPRPQPRPCSAHLCEMTGFQLELGHPSLDNRWTFVLGGRLKDDYGTVPRQYGDPQTSPHLSFLNGARITIFSSNALSASPHTWAQTIPTVGPWQPLDLFFVLPFPDPSILSPRLSFKNYCPLREADS